MSLLSNISFEISEFQSFFLKYEPIKMKVFLLLCLLFVLTPAIRAGLAGYAVYYTDDQCDTTPVLVTPLTTTTMTINSANATSCAANTVCAVNTADPGCTSLSGSKQVATVFSGDTAIPTVDGTASPRPIGACVASLTYSNCFVRIIQTSPTECLNSGSAGLTVSMTLMAVAFLFALHGVNFNYPWAK